MFHYIQTFIVLRTLSGIAYFWHTAHTEASPTTPYVLIQIQNYVTSFFICGSVAFIQPTWSAAVHRTDDAWWFLFPFYITFHTCLYIQWKPFKSNIGPACNNNLHLFVQKKLYATCTEAWSITDLLLTLLYNTSWKRSSRKLNEYTIESQSWLVSMYFKQLSTAWC